MKTKRLTACLLAITLLFSALSLCACGATQECEYTSFTKHLADMDEITACVYGDQEVYYELPVDDDLLTLMEGDFEKGSFNGGAKLLSLNIDMQYEICFFENGCSMIYYGFCGVFESDRQYYSYTLDNGIDDLISHIINTGKITEKEV